MTAKVVFPRGRKYCSALLLGTIIGGLAVPASAQAQQPPATDLAAPASATTAPVSRVVQSVTVSGNQRLEAETVLSYTALRIGENYDQDRLDQALRDLYATELFADVVISGADTGNLIIQVRENPVINRIVLEGNRRIKNDRITPEIRLAPRQIFTRSRARSDVARIIELYRRQGRYAASVEPQIVQLDQNRIDVVFEISEGPRSRVRRINIIGNEQFEDGRLIGEMATREHVWYNILGPRDTYDPDRLDFDQRRLRQFYLTQGYADFRVVSAVAEQTPDGRDFIISYVVDEGERYRFGDLAVESDIRDFATERLRQQLPMRSGDWYDARRVEDTVTRLNELAGLFGYAFAHVRPSFERSREQLTMGVTFRVAETPRVYVEPIDVPGNRNARDEVIRREFRLAEGEPFNNVRIRRSRDRIHCLGFSQDNPEIAQTQGPAPDRAARGVEAQERATDELQLSAGHSSLERFLVNASIRHRNFMGLGQELRASVSYSSYSKSVELGFTEPYLFDRNIAIGFDIYRRDLASFNFGYDAHTSPYRQAKAGGQHRAGVPLTEFARLALRYGLHFDDAAPVRAIDVPGLDRAGPISRANNTPTSGGYACDTIGSRQTSSTGYSLVWVAFGNCQRPNQGAPLTFNTDFAGLGGEVHYLRAGLNPPKYWNVQAGLIFSTTESGYAQNLASSAANVDPLRLTDRFFLGSPQIRGFDIRGVGPRIQNTPYDFDTAPTTGAVSNVRLTEDRNRIRDDAIGGRAYYLARAELEIPLGKSMPELGLRPSIFVDVGALWGVRTPVLADQPPGDPRLFRPILDANGGLQCTDNSSKPVITPAPAGGCGPGTALFRQQFLQPFREVFFGDSPSPRVSIGFGVNWNSPFGPFRIDIARALLSKPGDEISSHAPRKLALQMGAEQQPYIGAARGDLTTVPSPTRLRTSGISASRLGGSLLRALGNVPTYARGLASAVAGDDGPSPALSHTDHSKADNSKQDDRPESVEPSRDDAPPATDSRPPRKVIIRWNGAD